MQKKTQKEAEEIIQNIQRMNQTGSIPELTAQYDLACKHLLNEYVKNYIRLINLGK